jgi:uncharacterized protein YndB with AHSA1/START domain
MEQLKEKSSLTLTRHYSVSPEKIWHAWTQPEAIKRWWASADDEAVSVAHLDVRVGGRFRIVFGDHEVQGTYKDVVPNRRLAFTCTWPGSTPARSSLVALSLRPVAGGTDLVILLEQFFDETARTAPDISADQRIPA